MHSHSAYFMTLGAASLSITAALLLLAALSPFNKNTCLFMNCKDQALIQMYLWKPPAYLSVFVKRCFLLVVTAYDLSVVEDQ